MRRLFLGCLVLLLIGLGATHRLVKREGFTTFDDLRVDTIAPAFTLPRLEGGTFDLHSATESGQLVVVAFFTTWCEPCRPEIIELFRLSAQTSPTSFQFTLVLVDVGEAAGIVRGFLKSLPPQPPSAVVVLDESKAVATRYHVAGFPSLVVIDPWQRVRLIQTGFSPGILHALTVTLRAAQVDWRASRHEKGPAR